MERMLYSAKQLNVTFATVNRWENGTAMPTIDNLVVLAAIFGVAMDDIVVIDRDVKAQISA